MSQFIKTKHNQYMNRDLKDLLVPVSARQAKLLAKKGRRGSNQHKRKHAVTVRGAMALITLVILGITILYLHKTGNQQTQAHANEIHLEKAEVSGKSAQLETVNVSEVKKMQEFMKLQHEWNITAQEWMRQQQIINQGI